MHRSLRFVFATAVLCVALFTATTALAAPASWERVDVVLHPEDSGSVMLISGELPASAKLPARAELSVPAGAKLAWIGEILGGATSADPALAYTKSTVGSSDVYRFTLATSRKAQVEVASPGPQALDAASFETSLKWTATRTVPEVTLSVRVPEGARIVAPADGASLEAGDAGFSYYTKTVKSVKPGAEVELAFTYSLAAVTAAATDATGSGSTDATVLVIVVAAFLAVVVIASIAIRGRMRGNLREVTEVEAPEDDGDSAFAAEREDGSDIVRARQRLRATRNLVTATVIGGLLVFVIVVCVVSIRPQVSGGVISQTFSTGQPCADAEIGLTVPAGADPAKTAETLFAALRQIAGMSNAAYDAPTSTLKVGFCESETTEADIRAVLQPTGLVTQ